MTAEIPNQKVAFIASWADGVAEANSWARSDFSAVSNTLMPARSLDAIDMDPAFFPVTAEAQATITGVLNPMLGIEAAVGGRVASAAHARIEGSAAPSGQAIAGNLDVNWDLCSFSGHWPTGDLNFHQASELDELIKWASGSLLVDDEFEWV